MATKEKLLEKINEVSSIQCVLVNRFIKLEEWERIGKPRLLMEASSSSEDSVALFEDVGYGRLFLVVNDEVYQGKDFVSDPDGEWIGVSEYFTGGGGALLYRRVK